MLQQRRMAAQQVADSLFESEAAIDAAITAVAKLAGVMPAVRADANLSALIGQGALERAIEAMAELSAPVAPSSRPTRNSPSPSAKSAWAPSPTAPARPSRRKRRPSSS